MIIFPQSNPFSMFQLAELNNLITRNTCDIIVGWRWSKKFDRRMIPHQACKYIASSKFLFCKPSNKLPKL